MRATSGQMMVVAAVVLLAACAGSADVEEPGLTPGGAVAVPPLEARHFDPVTLRVGDRFGDLVVVDREVSRVFADSVWAGRYRFAGEIVVSGTYQRHFDWPEPAALCFHVTDPESIQRIPDFAPDVWTSPNAWTWFCFSNTTLAEQLLGPGAVPVAATVVVDDYLAVREFSDVFDTARLVRVLDRP